MSYPTIWTLPTERDIPGGTVPLSWCRSAKTIPISYHFLCPLCGTLWASVRIISEDSLHRAQHLPCREHSGGLMIPYERNEYDYLPAAPPAVLNYELESLSLLIQNGRVPQNFLYPGVH